MMHACNPSTGRQPQEYPSVLWSDSKPSDWTYGWVRDLVSKNKVESDWGRYHHMHAHPSHHPTDTKEKVKKNVDSILRTNTWGWHGTPQVSMPTPHTHIYPHEHTHTHSNKTKMATLREEIVYMTSKVVGTLSRWPLNFPPVTWRNIFTAWSVTYSRQVL